MEPLHTVTHARLRAAQGDVRGARGVLREILAVDPSRADARRLLADLEGQETAAHREPAEGASPPPTAASAASLVARFRSELGAPALPPRVRRIRRLRRWLDHVERNAESGP